MDSFDAIMIAEGCMPPPGDTPEEQGESIRTAWQHLIDTGLVWQLQGWFGRFALHLIEAGFCTHPTNRGTAPLEST
jgi:hypothetical protein